MTGETKKQKETKPNKAKNNNKKKEVVHIMIMP